MSNNHNAALKYKLKIKKMVFYLDNSYFYNQIFNQIALVSTNAVNIEYTYKNIDRFKSIGSNFNISSTWKGLRMVLGGSYTGIYNNAFKVVGKGRYMYSPELRVQTSYSSFHNAGSNTMPVSVGRSLFLQLNYKL